MLDRINLHHGLLLPILSELAWLRIKDDCAGTSSDASIAIFITERQMATFTSVDDSGHVQSRVRRHEGSEGKC